MKKRTWFPLLLTGSLLVTAAAAAEDSGGFLKSVENVNLATVIAYKKDGVRHHFLDTYDEM